MDLPDELVIKILVELPWRYILQARLVRIIWVIVLLIMYSRAFLQVCRTWSSIVSRDVQLQFVIEVGAAGMRERPAGDCFTTRERIEKFKALQAAWQDISGATVHSYKDTATTAYDFKQGILAHAATYVDNGTTVFNFHRLPSRFSVIEPKSWSTKISSKIADFAIDPSQDLLVITNIPDERPE